MKILKVKILRDQLPQGTHYSYPTQYNASKIQVLCYESSLPENYEKVKQRGNRDEFLLGVVKDEDTDSFLQSSDIIEITKDEAIKLGEKWTKQVEKLTDEKKVLAICAKTARGEILTDKEKDALNPDSSESGVQKSRSFRDSLEEYLK